MLLFFSACCESLAVGWDWSCSITSLAVLQRSWDHAASGLLAALLSSTLPVSLVPGWLLLLPAAHACQTPKEDKMLVWHWRKEEMNGHLGSEGSFVRCVCTGMWVRPRLKSQRNIKQHVASFLGSGDSSKTCPRGPIKSAALLHLCGTRGCPWSSVRPATESREGAVQTPSAQSCSAPLVLEKGAGASLSLEGISEK